MSADPIVQDPTDTQSLNRYSYVSNNPLSYTDPTGFMSLGDLIRTVVAVVIAVVAIVYGQGWLVQAGLFTQTGVGTAIVADGIGGAIAGGITSGGDLKGILVGAVSGAAFAGLGTAGLEGVEAVAAYGTTGGVTSVMGGGEFQSGFLAAGFGALAGPQVEAFAEAAGETASVAAGTAASAVAGGIGSVLGGGKFANGAVTGAFSYAVGRAIGPSKAANDNRDAAMGKYAGNDNGTMCDCSASSVEYEVRTLKQGRTYRGGPLTVRIDAHSDIVLVEIEVYSEGDNLTVGKIVPGIGPKVPKSGGNGVTVTTNRVSGGRLQEVLTQSMRLSVGEHVNLMYEINPYYGHQIMVRGETWAYVGVDVRGYNHYPQEYLYGSSSK